MVFSLDELSPYSKAMAEQPSITKVYVLLVSSRDGSSVEIIRKLENDEMLMHSKYLPLCAKIRNLAIVLRMAKYAVGVWNDYLIAERSSDREFGHVEACYKLATLLAMLYMLDDHLSNSAGDLREAGLVENNTFSFWTHHRSDNRFLHLMRKMRNASQHNDLPIESWTKTRKIEGSETVIELDAKLLISKGGETIKLNEFNYQMNSFMSSVCDRQLIQKFRETLSPAYRFYHSLLPDASNQFPGMYVYIGKGAVYASGETEMQRLDVPGVFFENLRIGLGD